MKYDVVYAETNYDLIDRVNEAIAAGWRPFGGVCVVRIPETGEIDCYNQYYQAIVKKEWPRRTIEVIRLTPEEAANRLPPPPQ